MRLIDMSDYNRGARAYWLTTTLVGAMALGWAVAGVLRFDTEGALGVSGLTTIVFLCGLRPILIPGTKTSITPGDIFIFLTALFYGAAAATMVAATDALAASHRTSQRWTSRLGSPAVVSISVLASASMFERLLAYWHRHQLFTSTTLLLTLLLFSLAHFILNSLLTAIVYALKKRTPLLPLWWASYSWTSLT